MASGRQKKTILFQTVYSGKDEASVILYRKGTKQVIREIPFVQDDYQGILLQAAAEDVDPSRVEYNFRIGERIFQDEQARVVVGRTPFGNMQITDPHCVRCGFLSGGFDWEGDKPLRIPFEDTIAYYLHVRGFTKNRNSGVKNKGTFKGIEEKIPYLQELGINQVILMPAYEFDEIMRSPAVGMRMDDAAALSSQVCRLNYWGYGSGLYYAPKASYAAGKAPDLEFKSMVKALHRAGIEVIMEFSFPETTDVMHLPECLIWWMQEYHVDGFSLLCSPDKATAIAQCPQLARVKLMTGYFDSSRVFPENRKLPWRHLANINDGFKNDCRKLLKGDEDMLSAFVGRMRQNDKDIAWVNYIAGHDGFTLMDLVSYDKKHNEENGEQGRDGAACDYSWNCGVEGPSRKSSIRQLRLRQMKNAMAMLFLAQGTPMLLAGDEFGNSQGGNNNPWCIDSEVTWVDWSKQKSCSELTDFIKALIALRKQHPMLRNRVPLTGGDTISCGYPDFSCHSGRAWYGAFEYQNRHVGLMYCGLHAGEEAFIYAAFNLHWESQSLALPYLPEGMSWQVVLDTSAEPGNVTDASADLKSEEQEKGEAPAQAEGSPEREFTVPGRTVIILEGRKIQ